MQLGLQTWKGTIIAQSRSLSRPCVHQACSPATSRPQAAAQELKELIASYQTLREGGRGTAICATIAETARQCNLDRDVQLPEESSLDSLTLDDRDTVVGRVYSKWALLACCTGAQSACGAPACVGCVQLRWTGMLPGAFGCMLGCLLHASRGQGLLILGPSQVPQ